MGTVQLQIKIKWMKASHDSFFSDALRPSSMAGRFYEHSVSAASGSNPSPAPTIVKLVPKEPSIFRSESINLPCACLTVALHYVA